MLKPSQVHDFKLKQEFYPILCQKKGIVGQKMKKKIACLV